MARKSAFLTLGTQVGIQILGLLTGIVVARSLGPGGRGELAAIIAWVSMLAYLGNLGLPVAYAYASAREPSRIRQLLGNGVLAVLVQWPALILVGLLVLKLALSEHPHRTSQLGVPYLCLYLPLNLLTLYANAIQQGLGRYSGFNAVRLCVPASYLLGLGVLLATDHMSVGTVLAANLFSNLVTLLLALILIAGILRRSHNERGLFDLSALRRDIRYGLSAHLGTLQPFTSLRVDVLLLAVLLTPYHLGLYVAALSGAGLINAQGIALGMVVMPEVAKSPDHATQRQLITRFVVVALLLGLSTAALGLIWAEPLIRFIYGTAFVGAATALRLLLIGAIVASVYRVLADGLRGMGRPLSGTAAELASLAVGVPAILVLVPTKGVNGAAIAVGLASASALLVAARAVLRDHSIVGRRRERQSTETAALAPLAPDETNLYPG